MGKLEQIHKHGDIDEGGDDGSFSDSELSEELVSESELSEELVLDDSDSGLSEEYDGGNDDDSGEEDDSEEEDDNDSDEDDFDELVLHDEIHADEDDADNPHQDDDSDSSEDDDDTKRNTVGAVPVADWYRHEDHVGYDKHGEKVVKEGAGGGAGEPPTDAIDWFLKRVEGGKDARSFYDEYEGRTVNVTPGELDLLRRLREGRMPSRAINPHAPFDDWFSRETEIMPLSAAPEPKRRFVPSKHEAKKVLKLVRALRKGTLKTLAQKREEEAKAAEGGSEPYLLWGDDGDALLEDGRPYAEGLSARMKKLSHVAAPKQRRPGHGQSYNPPTEYLKEEQEEQGATGEDDALKEATEKDDDRMLAAPIPSMRQIPAYDKLVSERFERCLDLYLCPRVEKKRINIDPRSLLPALPKLSDLRPYPRLRHVTYQRGDTSRTAKASGARAAAVAVAVDPSGETVAVGFDDHVVAIFDVLTSVEVLRFSLPIPTEDDRDEAAVRHISWRPAVGTISDNSLPLGESRAAAAPVLAVAYGSRVLLVMPAVGPAAAEAAASVAAAASNANLAKSSKQRRQAGDTSAHGPLADTVSAVWVARHKTRAAAAAATEGSEASVASWGTYEHDRAAGAFCTGPYARLTGQGAVSISLPRANRANFVPCSSVAWHGKGDYFVSVNALHNRSGDSSAVVIHRLSSCESAKPFSKTFGGLKFVSFHPSKPQLFLGTMNHVRMYDLSRRALVKKFLSGTSASLSLRAGCPVHSSGDHFLCGAEDGTVSWFDTDLSTKPYKVLRLGLSRAASKNAAGAGAAISALAFHPRRPLFVACCDDATVHVYHGMVYADLMSNPTVIPLKTFRRVHTVPKTGEGVTATCFHPRQPWLFTAGADGDVHLFCD